MFESTRWRAKVADFSHSMLETRQADQTGQQYFLVGGTQQYSAPEWKTKLSTASLFKTDVFSYGLILGSVIVGSDIFDKFCEAKRHGRTMEECRHNFDLMKQSNKLRKYIIDLLYWADDTDLASRHDDISSTQVLLDLSLQHDPTKRDLEQIIIELTRYLALFRIRSSPKTPRS